LSLTFSDVIVASATKKSILNKCQRVLKSQVTLPLEQVLLLVLLHGLAVLLPYHLL
jgi:ubiquinone/menaquinone biosynthesis C-methylase UbiE